MPHYKNPLKKGRLIIEFDVQYPTDGTFDENLRQQLFNLLNHQPNLEEKVVDDIDIPVYIVDNINEVEEELNRKNKDKSESSRDVYNSDEEEGQEEHFGQTTTCRFM